MLFSLAQRLKREISLIPRRNTSPCCWNTGCSAKGLPPGRTFLGLSQHKLHGSEDASACGCSVVELSLSGVAAWLQLGAQAAQGPPWATAEEPLTTPLATNQAAKRALWGPIPALTKTQTASWLATPQGLPQTEGYRAHGCCWGPRQTARQGLCQKQLWMAQEADGYTAFGYTDCKVQ